MNGLEERVAKIEGTVSQMNERLNHMGDEMTEFRQKIDSLRDKIDSNFKWMLGLLIPMWITIIAAILIK